ncbi:MAG: transposase [Pseudomonas sp.]
MMGQLSSGQNRLFYSFNLEDHIPANHLLRSIDRCLDLSDLRHYLADFYSPIGRPLIDPELMIRMLVVGYCYGIRSERRLCEEAHLNLAYRCFCRLSLEDEVPNHSTFSKNRHGRSGWPCLFCLLMLAWMVEEKDIEPHVPVWDKTERKDDSFSISDFHWNKDAEEYRCPAGKALRSEWRAFKSLRSHVTKANTINFRSSQTDCATCPMKAKCCPNTAVRKIARSVHEAARDVARRIAKTPEYVRSRHERKKIEMFFAHLKRILKLDRLRLRGMSGATDEFTLAAAVQNLRRLAKLTAQGPPATG